jgi:Flp pilus assembly protein TadB
VSDSLDDRLRKTSEEVRDLEQQFDKFNRDNALRLTMGTLPPARIAEGQELQSRLYEARQRQTSLLLEYISGSSNRLEVATKTLNQTADTQLRTAESQSKTAESQVRVTSKLLRSSRRLEKLTVFLIVVTLANIVVVVENILPLLYTVILMGFVLLALFFAFRYPMAEKSPNSEKK